MNEEWEKEEAMQLAVEGWSQKKILPMAQIEAGKESAPAPIIPLQRLKMEAAMVEPPSCSNTTRQKSCRDKKHFE